MGKQPIKLLIDEQLWEGLALALQTNGFDAVHVNHVDLRATDDEKILHFAAKNHRAVLTNNHKDFAPLVVKWYESGLDHAGVILTAQLSRGELLRQTLNLLDTLLPGALNNSIRWLQEFR